MNIKGQEHQRKGRTRYMQVAVQHVKSEIERIHAVPVPIEV
jgi:hypothetical protein